MPNITIRPPYSNQDIHVYDFGDEIPGYVSVTYKPKIWYDQSKSVDGGTWDIFNELGIAETLILGESEDDLWTLEEILEEICRYFNLHIVQLGYDFYIFDWETSKSGNSVTWVNILDGTTKNSTYSTITPALSNYADDSTQISLGECYDKIKVTDEVEEFNTDVIKSPFDDLEDLCAKQIYMKELFATGKGTKAVNAFKNMLNGGDAQSYGDDSAWIKEWWFKVRYNKYWKLSTETWGDNYSRIPKDANNNYYQQWRLAQWVDSCPWASGFFSFGSGEKKNNKNTATIENIEPKDDYLVINVQGNGNDSTTGGTIYPSDNDILNSGMHIECINAEDGLYSAADPNITNYIVINGELTMSIPHERTGPLGFIFDRESTTFFRVVNEWTNNTNNFQSGYHYVDNEAFKRKNNTFASARSLFNTTQPTFQYYTVGSDDNDDGRFYTNLFYEQWYTNDTDTRETETNTYLAPPCMEGSLSKRFKYDLDNNKSYFYKKGGGVDVIPYINVLACKLQIGDKYCCERRDDNGNKVFHWWTEEELKNMGEDGYLDTGDGSTMYDAYIYLAIDINNQEYVVGDSHKIYNNVYSNMHLGSTTGMAIPLPSDEHLSGELKFSIEGVVNTTWSQGVRQHATWFRHETYSATNIPIMAHVDKIYIKNLKFEFKSDNGKVNVNDENDIVYMSDEIKKYSKSKDDITFKFNTALTSEEASAMNVAPIFAKSTVLNMTTGDAILGIVNNVTSETDKPEKFYVDAYWRELNEPRMIVSTALKETNSFANLDTTQFKKFTFPYIDDKTFFVVKTERDLKNETINLTLKERNQ